MSSTLQTPGAHLTDHNLHAQNVGNLMNAADRFERYKVLIRILAHQRSGTGQAMTKEERAELRQLTASCMAA